MALRELIYQNRVLTRLDDYLTELATQKKRSEKIAAANVGETDHDLIRPVSNFAVQTWEAMRAADKLPESRVAHHGKTSDVINAIKKGLEEDGMGDLVREIRVSDSARCKAGDARRFTQTSSLRCNTAGRTASWWCSK